MCSNVERRKAKKATVKFIVSFGCVCVCVWCERVVVRRFHVQNVQEYWVYCRLIVIEFVLIASYISLYWLWSRATEWMVSTKDAPTLRATKLNGYLLCFAHGFLPLLSVAIKKKNERCDSIHSMRVCVCVCSHRTNNKKKNNNREIDNHNACAIEMYTLQTQQNVVLCGSKYRSELDTRQYLPADSHTTSLSNLQWNEMWTHPSLIRCIQRYDYYNPDHKLVQTIWTPEPAYISDDRGEQRVLLFHCQ